MLESYNIALRYWVWNCQTREDICALQIHDISWMVTYLWKNISLIYYQENNKLTAKTTLALATVLDWYSDCQACCIKVARQKKRKKSKQTGSYIWEGDGTVSLHRFLDLTQAAVIPPRKLETQWPVGRNDRSANELDNTIGHTVKAITVPRQFKNHLTKTLHWLLLYAVFVPHRKELLHHLLRSISKENVEVEDPSYCPIGHSGSRLQSHLWTKDSREWT